MCDQTTNALPQFAAKKVKLSAITSPQRSPKLPDVPTTRELGIPQVDGSVWHGLYAPKGTPAPVIQQINNALQGWPTPGFRSGCAIWGLNFFPPTSAAKRRMPNI